LRRLRLIQSLFEKTQFKTYLEIGCYKGKTFLPIRAKRKIAVDPYFHPIFIKDALITILKTPQNITNRYFKETSDQFFLNRKSFLRRVSPLDVVFVDGLHTYEAALKDVLNALPYLNIHGVIVMHDCYPNSKVSALPTKSFPTGEDLKGVKDWTGAWSGDVWKAIVYLRENLYDLLDILVIDSDNGLGIIRLKHDLIDHDYRIKQKSFLDINSLTYDDLIKDLETFLNLKPN
jgi:hypothetical protein